MNKLKLSKLCAAVDVYYKKAQKVPQDMAAAENLTNSRIQSINSIDTKRLSFDEVKARANEIATSTTQASAWLDLQSNLITQEQFRRVYEAAANKIKSAEPASVSSPHDLPSAKPTAPTTKAPAKPHLNYEGPIDPKIQQILVYNFKRDLGKSGPNGDGVDGKLGTLTRKAINEIRDAVPATKGMSDKDFFAHLKEYYSATPNQKPSTPTEAIPVGGRVPRGRTGIV